MGVKILGEYGNVIRPNLFVYFFYFGCLKVFIHFKKIIYQSIVDFFFYFIPFLNWYNFYFDVISKLLSNKFENLKLLNDKFENLKLLKCLRWFYLNPSSLPLLATSHSCCHCPTPHLFSVHQHLSPTLARPVWPMHAQPQLIQPITATSSPHPLIKKEKQHCLPGTLAFQPHLPPITTLPRRNANHKSLPSLPPPKFVGIIEYFMCIYVCAYPFSLIFMIYFT